MRQTVLSVSMLVIMVLVSEWCRSCYGCLARERMELLEIKDWINYPNGSSWITDGWVDNGDQVAADNCCKWEGVRCDNTTRRVIQLNLEAARESLGELCLNASVFLPLQDLEHLNLASNGLVGCSKSPGFEVLASRLRKLKRLQLYLNGFEDNILSSLSGFSSLTSVDLSFNMLTGSTAINEMYNLTNLEELYLHYNVLQTKILHSIGALPALKVLKLHDCSLNGILPRQGWCELKNLELLDLSRNNLKGLLPSCLGNLSSLCRLDLFQNEFSGFQVLALRLRNLKILDLRNNKFNDSIVSSLSELSAKENVLTGSTAINELYNLTNLEELSLDNNSLSTNVLHSIGVLSALKVLTLQNCSLNGTLPTQGWCELKNLEQLILSGNNLDGLLPDCLGNLSSLQLLDLSVNQFNGNIASSPLTNLTSLTGLVLSNNNFEVPLSFKSFANHTNLKLILCDNNKLVVEPTLQSFIPKFQLQDFSLSKCTSKSMEVEIPNFLYNQYDLRVLDLSKSNFSGLFPSWLFEKNTRLERLYLGGNSFIGPMQLRSHLNLNLSTIHFSRNKIQGPIPKNLCANFPNLNYLNLAENNLTGHIPSCFGNESSLYFLDLSNNQLFGGVPEQLTSITSLRLSNNNLDGKISPLFFNSSTLQILFLDGNNFGGQISDISSTVSSASLTLLDFSNNHLSGPLPIWIGNMSSLVVTDFSTNHFDGPIPREFCKLDSLEFVRLSNNLLSGYLPSCFNPQSLSYIHLSKNQLSGPLRDAFFNCSNLVTLDLGQNSFTSNLPKWIGKLSTLSVLILKDNYFVGELPSHLCLLEQLSILDASKNKFSGHLPTCLGSLSFKPKIITNLFFPLELGPNNSIHEVIEFTTKKNSYLYGGDILNLMSGIDLSDNKFIGEIPQEFGKLSEIRALNLSHNNLTGHIPITFSDLKQIESLDLFYNNLNGGFPLQITQLKALEVFSVAYNKLSGNTPERKYQFGTFEESSYEGNPLLGGAPLRNNCSEIGSPTHPVSQDSNGEREDDGFMDMDIFYISFGVCYFIMALAIVLILYINQYWRHRWFYLVEECIDTCYCFWMINFHKLSNLTRRS